MKNYRCFSLPRLKFGSLVFRRRSTECEAPASEPMGEFAFAELGRQ